MGELLQGILFFSMLAGMATIIGVFIVFYFGTPNRQSIALYLGLAAGVMITVSIDLIIHSAKIGHYKTLLMGLVLGALLMALLSGIIAIIHKNFTHRRGSAFNVKFAKIGWTMVLGIAAHNLPEGLAIAAGEAADHKLGIAIVIAIALHNVPEGIGVTAPLLKSGTRKAIIVIALIFVALCVPMGTLLGLYIIEITPAFISLALSFAAGAMMYIVVFELTPAAFKQQPIYAQLGIVVGIIALYAAHSI
ncbi:ZIP family metal transporter [Desulfuribacillus alkaliarsenatis]|uniref:Dihydroorotate dehydrogenase n=1 Tax=Desulfuribacillus alkaliarsenatis TaxID=766136 RepID=A0A1E5G1I1_9FIRM|nr:ZIP family metal transporter [Desulfuribacillus alkaliarsenatis]OEF96767.1 hypothetical protein BHF68_06775 [Desulfuribacillus alkaliarsenatis]